MIKVSKAGKWWVNWVFAWIYIYMLNYIWDSFHLKDKTNEYKACSLTPVLLCYWHLLVPVSAVMKSPWWADIHVTFPWEKPYKHITSHFLARTLLKLGMMVHTFNPSNGEADTGGFLGVWGQFGMHSEFQESQGYAEPLPQQNEKNAIARASTWSEFCRHKNGGLVSQSNPGSSTWWASQSESWDNELALKLSIWIKF